MIRTTFIGSPSGRSWVAHLQAWSRSEIHRYAAAVLYAWRGGAPAPGLGGGPEVPSDLSDWRGWPAECQTELDELEDRALRLLQVARVKHDGETVDILVPFVAALHHRSMPSLPKRFSSS